MQDALSQAVPRGQNDLRRVQHGNEFEAGSFLPLRPCILLQQGLPEEALEHGQGEGRPQARMYLEFFLVNLLMIKAFIFE